ncbi:hypothetical protein [Streptomyces narbonensis]|uniref:hypothetical protein n=1 Tax=Streptomyces narbonensis TaxID=67333 RepID=UPI0033C73F5E
MAEREAVAEAERERAAKAEKEARRQGWTAIIGLASLTLAMLWGVASCSLSAWDEQERDAACEPHRQKALALDAEAREVEVPLVLSFDQNLLRLQLTRSLPRSLGSPSASAVTEGEIAAAYQRKRELAGEAAKVVLDHQDCLPGFVEAAQSIESSPLVVTRVEMPAPAHCSDGWPSGSIGRQGACSHHGGVVAGSPWATLRFD